MTFYKFHVKHFDLREFSTFGSFCSKYIPLNMAICDINAPIVIGGRLNGGGR